MKINRPYSSNTTVATSSAAHAKLSHGRCVRTSSKRPPQWRGYDGSPCSIDNSACGFSHARNGEFTINFDATHFSRHSKLSNLNTHTLSLLACVTQLLQKVQFITAEKKAVYF